MAPILGASLVRAVAKTMNETETTFQAFVEALHAFITEDPNICIELGVEKNLDRLPNRSRSTDQAYIERCDLLLAQSREIDVTSLSADEALDLDLARQLLEYEKHSLCYRFNGRTMLDQCPMAAEDISYGIFSLFVDDPRSAERRLADILGRVDGIPEYLETLLARLDTPVKRWVEIDLESVKELPGLLSTIVDWADRAQWDQIAQLKDAVQVAGQALEAYSVKLADMPTTTRMHMAREDAEKLVALKGIELGFEALHEMAVEFLDETNTIIEELRGKLAGKYGLDEGINAKELQHYLHNQFAVSAPGSDLNEILDYYSGEREKVLAFVQQRDLFPIPADQDMEILRTPSFMVPTIPAGAMQPPAPFREGKKISQVLITLSESLRDEHTRLSIPGMMIHEGIPGHHLHLASVAMNPSVVRRHYHAADQSEGWTTMLEDYMLDMGYMGDLTDEARFIWKYDIARIGARVAIDLFFMTGDKAFLDVGIDCDLSSNDPFVAAGNLLEAVTGFVDERVRGEINWYSQVRGYPLSYLTGNRLVWQLKRDMQNKMKGKLEGIELDRSFHRAFLACGDMPMSFMRRKFVEDGLVEP